MGIDAREGFIVFPFLSTDQNNYISTHFSTFTTRFKSIFMMKNKQ